MAFVAVDASRSSDSLPPARVDPARGQLIVVSNRLPLTVRRSAEGWRAESSSGGLTTALAPVMARRGGLWIGWPGEAPEAADEKRTQVLARWEKRHGFVTVELPPAL